MQSNTKKILVISAIIIGVLIIGFIIYQSGTKGIAGLLDASVTIGIWLGVIAIIVILIYFLFFFEKKINASLEVFKDIKKESKINRLNNLKSLYLTGSEDFSRPIEIGKIVGFSSRKTYGIDKKDNKQYFQNETIFLIKKKSYGPIDAFFKMFSRPILLRTPADLHTKLHGDVYVKSNSLVKHLYYYYPDVVHLDVKAIDETLYYEGERYIQLNFVSKIDPILSRAVGVTKEDLAQLQGRTGLEMVKDKGQMITGQNNNQYQGGR